MMPLMLVKAHAFGNDFILVESRAISGAADLPALAPASARVIGELAAMA